METVRCPCGDNEDDGLMICCEICNTWQHALCFQICVNDSLENHICNLCDKKPRENPEELKMLCLRRRALGACLESSYFSIQGMSNRIGCDLKTSRLILDLLLTDGYLTLKGNKHKRWFVNKQMLSSHISGKNVESLSTKKKFFLWDL